MEIEMEYKERCRKIMALGSPYVTQADAVALTGASMKTTYNYSNAGLIPVNKLYDICENRKDWNRLLLMQKYLPSKWPDIQPTAETTGETRVGPEDTQLAKDLATALETAFAYRFFPSDALHQLFVTYPAEQSVFVYRPPAENPRGCIFGKWVRYTEFRRRSVSDFKTNYNRLVDTAKAEFPDEFEGEFCSKRAALFMVESNMRRRTTDKVRNAELLARLRAIDDSDDEYTVQRMLPILNSEHVITRVKKVMCFIRQLTSLERFHDDNAIAFLTALHQYCGADTKND